MTRILHTINYDENKYDDAYDIFIAYDENNELPFRKYKSGGLGRINAKKGDTVYLYIGEPIRKIMYKCIITDDNKDKNETINDEEYFKSKNHKQNKNDTSKTCYILKKLQFIDTENLNFTHVKKSIGDKGENLTSFRNDYTDKHEQHLKEMFNYIENIFKDDCNTNLQSINYADLQIINDEFNSIDDEFDNKKNNSHDILQKYKDRLVKQRIGQGKWRDYLIKNNGCKCALCDISMKELLIASHIKEYSKCEKNAAEHLDLKNGLLLCANHDKLFDKHLISFNMDGTIKISDRVPKSQYEILRIDNCDNISIESFDEKYMSYHRNILNENNIG
ncbi:HNH endonuclease [Clostridium beijerinckii]|uniref:Restriction endonuclease n=2 Tax=Clostridium beijerinckii TaxID=1520 RepID=A0A9Q5CQX0_CLOBE|nr:HNH endonuclease [Clostridium beijerinckii]AQS05894.1 hypothetical protein CLBIJ_33370 [Clostridium beijerinckii]MBA2887879.1 putative restriction endonuclease [Clostridium beijerinckii]MBA2902613.1 putative restriction endonuclease [Clostridium beijerinckii]MBA2912410.1 putative restriction endonuclease [Clostridium beijerinckii]MBA9014507.1 putative restriction endonuclease [Clostridium beijerinckii]